MTKLNQIAGAHVARVHIVGQATAGTADEFPGVTIPFNAVIVGAKWIPKAAVVADATNYLTLTVRNRTTGAGAVNVANRSYAATNSAALTPEAMTLSATAANLLVAAGDLLTVEKLNTGTGLALPAGVVEISYQIR